MKKDVPADPDAFIRRQAARADFDPYPLADLQHRQFPELRQSVAGLLYEGCTILAAKPKMRKTFLLTQIAIAVATGEPCLGDLVTTRGECLFLALEDGERSMQWRCTKILGAWRQDWPAGFHVVHRWPRGKEAVDLLRDYLRRRPQTSFIVVDVLARILPPPDPKKRESYLQDYEAIVALADLAHETGVTIVVIHHLRKSEGGDDALDAISGTLGIVGAADGALVMQRDGQGISLVGRHRYAPDIELALAFDNSTFQWSVLGDRATIQRSAERRAILDLLVQAGEPMRPQEIAKALARPDGTIRRLLFEMTNAGEVSKPKTGFYTASIGSRH